eukprot:g3584.t1
MNILQKLSTYFVLPALCRRRYANADDIAKALYWIAREYFDTNKYEEAYFHTRRLVDFCNGNDVGHLWCAKSYGLFLRFEEVRASSSASSRYFNKLEVALREYLGMNLSDTYEQFFRQGYIVAHLLHQTADYYFQIGKGDKANVILKKCALCLYAAKLLKPWAHVRLTGLSYLLRQGRLTDVLKEVQEAQTQIIGEEFFKDGKFSVIFSYWMLYFNLYCFMLKGEKVHAKKALRKLKAVSHDLPYLEVDLEVMKTPRKRTNSFELGSPKSVRITKHTVGPFTGFLLAKYYALAHLVHMSFGQHEKAAHYIDKIFILYRTCSKQDPRQFRQLVDDTVVEALMSMCTFLNKHRNTGELILKMSELDLFQLAEESLEYYTGNVRESKMSPLDHVNLDLRLAQFFVINKNLVEGRRLLKKCLRLLKSFPNKLALIRVKAELIKCGVQRNVYKQLKTDITKLMEDLSIKNISNNFEISTDDHGSLYLSIAEEK